MADKPGEIELQGITWLLFFVSKFTIYTKKSCKIVNFDTDFDSSLLWDRFLASVIIELLFFVVFAFYLTIVQLKNMLSRLITD